MCTLLHTVLLHAVFAACSFYCTEFCCTQLFLQTALLRVNSFAHCSALIYCTQFGAHIFDAHRLDAQCFATLLYYTITIQLRYYSDYTSATLLHDCHSTATLLHYCHVLLHTLAALRHHCYTASTLRVNSHKKHITVLHTIPQHCCTTDHTTATLLPHYCHAFLLHTLCSTRCTTAPRLNLACT